MTKDEADALRDRRKAEHPECDWVVQQRAADDWAVMRLPGGLRIDPGSVEGRKGEPVDLADDPRSASARNVPPWAAGM